MASEIRPLIRHFSGYGITKDYPAASKPARKAGGGVAG